MIYRTSVNLVGMTGSITETPDSVNSHFLPSRKEDA